MLPPGKHKIPYVSEISFCGRSDYCLKHMTALVFITLIVYTATVTTKASVENTNTHIKLKLIMDFGLGIIRSAWISKF